MSITDHDECATNVHDCDTLAPATCHNSHGSFYCTCPIGFRLNADGRTCDGESSLSSIPVSIGYNYVFTKSLDKALIHEGIVCFSC